MSLALLLQWMLLLFILPQVLCTHLSTCSDLCWRSKWKLQGFYRSNPSKTFMYTAPFWIPNRDKGTDYWLVPYGYAICNHLYSKPHDMGPRVHKNVGTPTNVCWFTNMPPAVTVTFGPYVDSASDLQSMCSCGSPTRFKHFLHSLLLSSSNHSARNSHLNAWFIT